MIESSSVSNPLDSSVPTAPGALVLHPPVPLREVRRDVLRRVLARLDEATDLAAAASAVDLCVPAFADVAGVQLLDGSIHGDDPTDLVPGAGLWVRGVTDGPGVGFRPGRALSAGAALREAMESRHVVQRSWRRPSSAAPVTDDLDQDLGAVLDGGDLVAVPLICGGRTTGVLTLLRKPGRSRLSASDVETIEQVAGVTALRLDHLRLSAEMAVAKGALLRALSPVVPAQLNGVDVGIRYRTARPGDGVGGDWLDAIPLPGGRTAFTVGDVMGHGTPAAVLMDVLRSSIRALAPLHLDPAQLLRQLDDLAVQFQTDRPHEVNWLATCLYAVYDPVTRVCEVAAAGHPSPVLTGVDGRSALLALEPGTPIGVGAGRFRTSRLTVPDGSQLILYTDGLVEVRSQDIEHGMDALCRRASATARRPLDQVCQDLLDRVEVSEYPDDVALLVARFRGLPADRVAAWTLTADPDLAGHAGWLTARALQRWGLHEFVDTVVPLVDELVANVVRHGAGPVTLRLMHSGALLCEVSDTSGHLPTERVEPRTGRSGQGLRLLSRARRWGAYRTATGKVVWFEYPLAG